MLGKAESWTGLFSIIEVPKIKISSMERTGRSMARGLPLPEMCFAALFSTHVLCMGPVAQRIKSLS